MDQKDMKEIEKVVREVRRPEQVVDQNIYLLSFLEAEGERYISIKASNILEALMKFAQQYHSVCMDWQGISLNIELIESID